MEGLQCHQKLHPDWAKMLRVSFFLEICKEALHSVKRKFLKETLTLENAWILWLQLPVLDFIGYNYQTLSDKRNGYQSGEKPDHRSVNDVLASVPLFCISTTILNRKSERTINNLGVNSGSKMKCT